MLNFGYSLTPSARIDLDNVSGEVIKKFDELYCIQCGSCAAVCTSGKFTTTSLRRAILSIQNGEIAEGVSLLKGCMLCGKCFMVCPRAINTRNLILSISKLGEEK